MINVKKQGFLEWMFTEFFKWLREFWGSWLRNFHFITLSEKFGRLYISYMSTSYILIYKSLFHLNWNCAEIAINLITLEIILYWFIQTRAAQIYISSYCCCSLGSKQSCFLTLKLSYWSSFLACHVNSNCFI